eukprot:gene7284-8097_t
MEKLKAEERQFPGLINKEKIQVKTENGQCEIDFVYGSVTKLEKKDEVDVLVVSAFPNNYQETPYSVIGALKRDLGLVMGDLAKDKEEDLRNIFSCWWSKELPSQYSYRRILCFEGAYKAGARPPTVIGEIFRCLVSLCKNKDIKVMMPLITTGHQGYSPEMILCLIVEAAIHWMQIGLPLRVLKIVAYTKDFKQIKGDNLLDNFQTLKKKWLVKEEQRRKKVNDPSINYDVYLSYSPKDQHMADKILRMMREMNQGIAVFNERQEINQEKSWQRDIYKVMVSCARVVTILSANFMADESCLEQYNIALCCTRNMRRDYLAPFYANDIDVMPTYMGLIQYVDCRPFSEESVSTACSMVTRWLSSNVPQLKMNRESPLAITPHTSLADHYDVFISYSHQNSDIAHQIKQHIMIFHPDWKIFIDVADLKTGVAWQTKLYNSIENSKIVLSLLSPPYVASKVCQEEYNLALALNCDTGQYSTVLFPVLVQPIEKMPTWCSGYRPLDLCGKNMAEFLRQIKLLEELGNLRKPRELDMNYLMEDWRRQNMRNNYPYMSMVSHEAIGTFYRQKKKQLRKMYTIALCYHEADKTHVNFFRKRLTSYLLGPVLVRPQESSRGNLLIDEADLVVLFLSPEFLNSPELIEQANIALCRQRVSDRLVMISIVLDSLPTNHAYLRLLACFFSCNDEIWQERDVSLRTRLSWLSTLKKPAAICLDTAASFAGFVVSNSEFFFGSYKTLLSVGELEASCDLMKNGERNLVSHCDPLHFDAMLSVDQNYESANSGHSSAHDSNMEASAHGPSNNADE